MIRDRFPHLTQHLVVLMESWKQQNDAKARANPKSDHEFLPAALEIIERPPSPGLRWLLLSLCVLFSAALAWSFIGKVDVVATASGKVVPSGNVKIIQPMEIGYIRKIHVQNGERVVAGQLLVELDPTIAEADAAQSMQELQNAEVIAARNSAMLEHVQGRRAHFVPPSGTPAHIIATQREFVSNAIAQYESERASLFQRRAEHVAELAAAQAEISKLNQILPLMDQQLAARKELTEKGYFSKIRLLEYEQQRIEHIQNIAIQQTNASKARAAVRNIDAQIAQLRSSFGKAAAAEMAEAQVRSGLSREEVTKSKRQATFQQLRAPVSGTVQQLAISTIGGVVQPAQSLMVIVPDEAAVLLEANILNKDIGFIHEGQPVRVKLEAFNFTDYGVVMGVVDSVSRDAVDANLRGQQQPKADQWRSQSQQDLVYVARIRLNKSTIRVGNRDQVVRPGLAAQVEIKTGERRIIDFLLSPLARTVDEAGRER